MKHLIKNTDLNIIKTKFKYIDTVNKMEKEPIIITNRLMRFNQRISPKLRNVYSNMNVNFENDEEVAKMDEYRIFIEIMRKSKNKGLIKSLTL